MNYDKNYLDIVSIKHYDSNEFNITYDNNMTKKITLGDYNTINFEKDLIEKFIGITSTTIENEEYTDINYLIDKTFESLKKTKTLEKFIIVNDSFNNENILNDIKIFKTSFIENKEIICGYKTDINEPGISIFYNAYPFVYENDNIKLTIAEIGFFPNSSYKRIKL